MAVHALSWKQLKPRMFVRVFAFDHWEEHDDDEAPDEGRDEPVFGRVRELHVCPFELRGQVMHITSTHLRIEGAWIWLENDEWNHGTYVVVRGAVRGIKPL